jgi:choline dehydrogenase-like flavoprotein
MIINGNDAAPGTEHRADVIVIGAGAAGIPAAAELEKAGLTVLLVESGGMQASVAANDLSKGSVVNPQHGALDHFRVRAFGGTTSVWGGRVAPLDEIDFERRTYVSGSGWPISSSDLQPFYRLAHEYLHAGSYDYSASTAGLTAPRSTQGIVPFSSPSFHGDMLWRFSDPIHLGKTWRRKFEASPRVRVLLNTTAVRLITSADGQYLTSCELRSLSARSQTATGQVVIIAAGGLETTRLLQASSCDMYPTGFGNVSGTLGRYYTSHLAGLFGPFRRIGSKMLPGSRYERDPQGVYVRRTLSLRPQIQRELGLLNFRTNLSLPAMYDPSHESAVLSSAFLAKRFVLRRIPPEFDAQFGREDPSAIRRQHVGNVLKHLPELAAFAPWWAARRIMPTRKIPSMEANVGEKFFLHFDAEQTPLWDSTVLLGDQHDALGVPRLAVEWRVRPGDVDSLVNSYGLLRQELRDAGIATAEESEDQAAERVYRELGVGSHHIGTTRMSSSAASGVVDTDCRVHGLKNLYVASASVFCTAGVANPTLTITAIALRIAKMVASELGAA